MTAPVWASYAGFPQSAASAPARSDRFSWHRQARVGMDQRTGESELKALMVAGLNGDAAAHRSLLSKLSGHLRAYFKRRLTRIGRGPVDAEDLLQEVLIAIHTRRHTYDREQPFTPWLHAIARYRFLDYLRRTKGTIKDVPIEEASDITAADDFGSIDSAFDLERAMAGLSAKTRRSIQYVKLEGLSVSETAERLGMSTSAVKVSVHRGLRALSRLFAKGRGP